MAEVVGTVAGQNRVAVTGTSTGGLGTIGVLGKGEAVGLQGEATFVTIPAPTDVGAIGVVGKGQAVGVRGEGTLWNGVEGIALATSGAFGVFGAHLGGGVGVRGDSSNSFGVWGSSSSRNDGAGVMGESTGTVAGVRGKGTLAGLFEGDVHVTGDIKLLNADCAEDFTIDATEAIEPGTVMVLRDEGMLVPSQTAYDKRVAGVVSGGGNYKPAIVLDRQEQGGLRQPIALLGKAFCKVDAQFGEIEVGDLLTTSPTPGHAMKAADPMKAFGAVIGKALQPLREGQGLVPLLIALQ